MPEIHSALAGSYTVGRHPADAEPGVTLQELTGWDLLQVAAWRGRFEALCATVEQVLGTAPPTAPNCCTRGTGIEVLSVAPQRLWCVAADDPSALDRLAYAVDEDTGCALRLDHSHVRIRLAGPATRGLLAREIAIDTDPQAFPSDTIARTTFHHASVVLQCIDTGAGTFDLHIPYTFAGSAWEYLLDLARAEGYEIRERIELSAA